MKKLVSILLVLFLVFGIISTAQSDVATPSDLREIRDFSVTLSNLSQYSIVALNNAGLNGHTRGSIWVGGTLTSGEWKFVDDCSLGGVSNSDSYVHNNNSSVQFKGRTSAQSTEAYYGLTDAAISNTRNYWYGIIANAGENETWIYLEPDENGHVDIMYWDYQCSGSDESQSSIGRIYWTDATSVTMGGLAGHLIAPYANVTIVSCNHCGSIVANNITTSGEAHINYWTPPSPPTPTPEPTPTPTPTPTVDITVNKTLIGSVWHIRCDYMDGETFHAGGGLWRRDWIMNPSGNTSKEGHRSNKCGDAEHWVIWVDANGQPFRMDEIKSGATGGTLPTVIYKPSTQYPITEAEIREMGRTGDPDLVWKYNQQFVNGVMDWSDIKIGVRMFWTTSNKGQVWYHTGVPYKVENPTYTIYIDGEGYDLVSNGGAVTIEDLEVGIHTIVEEKYPDTYVSAIYVDGVALQDYDGTVNITADTKITIENTLITPPPTSSPTPPPTTSVPTSTPSPTPSESPSESPSPSPSPSESPSESPSPSPSPSESISPSPSPTPMSYCTFKVRKVISNPENMSGDAIFFFKVTGTGLEEPEYIEISVSAETGEGTYTFEEIAAGKYTVEEIDIPEEYEIVSEIEITQYIAGEDMEFVFTNKAKELPSPSPSPSPTTATPTDLTPTPPPTTVTPSEVPSESPTPTPSPTPSPTVTTSPIPSETPTETPTATPKPTIPPDLPPEVVEHIVDVKLDENGDLWYKLDTIPIIEVPKEEPQPIQTTGWVKYLEIDEYDTALGVAITINHCGDSFD